MTHETPDHLRLYLEGHDVAAVPAATPWEGLDPLSEAFARLTSWRLRYREQLSATDRRGWHKPLPGSGPAPEGALILEPEGTLRSAYPPPPVTDLAEQIGNLLAEWQQACRGLWEREAELATAIPVSRRLDRAPRLAERLEGILKCGAEAVGCQAAALYLLDDTTSHLKLRACWGLPKKRFCEPPRNLRGAIADLEALLGHAVVLEDTSLLTHWRTPEGFRSAVCVPLSSDTTLLGTMWLFHEQVRDFSATETNLVELVAGRIVAELETEVLWRQQLRGHEETQTYEAVARWQNDQQPQIAPLVDQWQVDGWSLDSASVRPSFHDWSILPDGELAVALGACQGPAVAAALSVGVLQTATRCHGQYVREPRQLLDRVQETYSASQNGERMASLFFGLANPEGDTLRFALAGSMTLVVVRQTGLEMATRNIAPLGTVGDLAFREEAVTLKPGEGLIVIHGGSDLAQRSSFIDTWLAQAKPLARALRRPLQEWSNLVRETLRGSRQEHPVTVLVVRRPPTTGRRRATPRRSSKP